MRFCCCFEQYLVNLSHNRFQILLCLIFSIHLYDSFKFFTLFCKFFFAILLYCFTSDAGTLTRIFSRTCAISNCKNIPTVLSIEANTEIIVTRFPLLRMATTSLAGHYDVFLWQSFKFWHKDVIICLILLLKWQIGRNRFGFPKVTWVRIKRYIEFTFKNRISLFPSFDFSTELKVISFSFDRSSRKRY